MRGLIGLAFVVMPLAGCAGLSPDLIRELGKDPAANCVSVTTVYGAITMARGTPETSVSVAGGQCTITGSTTAVGAVVAPPIMVPVQMMVVPAVPKP